MGEIKVRFISANATPDMTQPGIVEVADDDLAGRTFQISDQEGKLSIVPLMVVNRDLGDETDDSLSGKDMDRIARLLWAPEVKEKVTADFGVEAANRFRGLY